MSSLTTIRVVCTNANTAYNLVTGTTSAPTTARDSNYVGDELTVQNQTANSIVSLGGSNVVTVGGVQLTYQAVANSRSMTPTGIQLQEWWVSSNTPGTVVLVILRKRV